MKNETQHICFNRGFNHEHVIAHDMFISMCNVLLWTRCTCITLLRFLRFGRVVRVLLYFRFLRFLRFVTPREGVFFSPFVFCNFKNQYSLKFLPLLCSIFSFFALFSLSFLLLNFIYFLSLSRFLTTI